MNGFLKSYNYVKEVVMTEGSICNAEHLILLMNQFDVSKNLYIIHLMFLLLIKIETNNLKNAYENREESLF